VGFGLLRKRANGNVVEYQKQINDAVNVLEGVRTGIGNVFWLADIVGDRLHKSSRHDIWAWPTEAQVEEWAFRGTGRAGLDDLDNALAVYVKRPWLQNDAIDASAINALLVTELAELVLDVKTGAAIGKPNWSFVLSGGNQFAQLGLALVGRIVGFFAAWVMLPAFAIGQHFYGRETEAIIAGSIWGLYVVYRLIMIPSRWRLRRLREKAAETTANRVTAIVKAWNAARGSAINPSRLKELVLAAEECGATFPSVLHTIIDRAINRDATALVRQTD